MLDRFLCPFKGKTVKKGRRLVRATLRLLKTGNVGILEHLSTVVIKFISCLSGGTSYVIIYIHPYFLLFRLTLIYVANPRSPS